jgi:hypothetical protein
MRVAIALALSLLSSWAFGQASLDAFQSQAHKDQLVVIVSGLTDVQLQAFAGGAGKISSNYHVFEIQKPDSPEMTISDVTSKHIPPNQKVDFDGALLTVPLIGDFDSKLAYVVTADNVARTVPRLSVRISGKATVTSFDVNATATKIKISCAFYIKPSAKGLTITRRRVMRDKTGKLVEAPVTYHASQITAVPDGLLVTLDKKLNSAQPNEISVSGLEDGPGEQIAAKGKITVTGVPANEKDAWLLLKTSSSEAVHAAPVFEFTGNVAPLNPGSLARYLCKTGVKLCDATSFDAGSIRFNPSINFDIGFNTTKASNSVVVPAPLQKVFYRGNNNFNLAFGPRFETDRRFARYNVLGEGRFEFVFSPFSDSVSTQKKRLGSKDQAAVANLEGINWGYEFIPYVQFDGGGHVNKEVVTNTTTKVSVTVPAHTIARTYVGLQTTLEYKRATLAFDSSMIDFGTQEIIGYTTKKSALLRHVDGIQPHTKLSFDYALDVTKHFSLNISYENGRSAPNFEYLNKVDTGLKLLF